MSEPPAPTSPAAPYRPRREPAHRFVPVRGIDYHLTQWGEPVAGQPVVVMVHGFMDVGASFQFVVDALAALGHSPCVVAPDWRGFGLTHATGQHDAYWFPDYLGDLDALLDAVSPDAPVDLLGHSMGGNVVMSYAGARPERIRRLVNLEGFGLPDTTGAEAPGRLAQWLDELRTPQRLKPYADKAAVAARMQRNNPRLTPDKALWLAAHWAEPGADGQWHLRADPAHRRINPVLWRAAETLALYGAITAPLLWAQGRDSRTDAHWGGRYSFAEFQQRLTHVPQVTQVMLDDCGHMLHHDQPEALARALADFWRAG
jgi:pimeloyl-ACP methyl ester carboxylesterase